MYFLPWNETIIAGTTEFRQKIPTLHPKVSKESVELIKLTWKEYFDFEPVITSKWGGVRSLCKSQKGGVNKAKNLSRIHIIEHDKSSNLISVMGGKWTIFRKMGEEAANAALDLLFNDKQISEDFYINNKKRNTINLRLNGDFRELDFDIKQS